MPHLQAFAMQDDSPRIIPPLARGDALGKPEASATPPTPDDARIVRSEDLFAGARVVLIQHADEQYRLLITRNNRLILQK
jgi:hemin uptake protein HemP